MMKRIALCTVALGLLLMPACKKDAANSDAAKPAPVAANADAAKADGAANLAPVAINADAAKADGAANPVADAANADAAKADGAANSVADAANADAAKTPKPTKLVFSKAPKGDVLEKQNNADGTYILEYFVDGLLVVGVSAMAHQAYADGEDVARAARKWKDEPYNIRVVRDDEMAKNMGHTAWKLTYLTGHNEDTWKCEAYLYEGDAFDYRHHTCVDADAMSSDAARARKKAGEIAFVEISD